MADVRDALIRLALTVGRFLVGIARLKDNLTQRIAQAVDYGLLNLDPPIQFFGWNFGVLDLAGP
jgi:ABC-type amino acid transport system permease subunit